MSDLENQSKICATVVDDQIGTIIDKVINSLCNHWPDDRDYLLELARLIKKAAADSDSGSKPDESSLIESLRPLRDGRICDRDRCIRLEKEIIGHTVSLKAYSESRDKITFRRFTRLNCTNILMIQYKLMELEAEYFVNPVTFMEKQSILANLLAEYSAFPNSLCKALQNYERVLKFEQAQLTSDYVLDILFKLFAINHVCQRRDDELNTRDESEPDKLTHVGNLAQLLGRYDDIKIAEPKAEPLSRLFFNMHFADSIVHTKAETNYLAIARHLRKGMKDTARWRSYGHTRIISELSRASFGLYGAIALLVPMIALTFIQNKYYRLLATTLFVLIFVFALIILSNASRQDIVTATLAYSAVLVVFVGSALGS